MPADQFNFGHAFLSWLAQHASRSKIGYELIVEHVTTWGRRQGFPSYIADWGEDQCLSARDWLKNNAPGRTEQGGDRGGVPASERAPDAARVPSSGVGTDRPRGTLSGYIHGSEPVVDWTPTALSAWVEDVAAEERLDFFDLMGIVKANGGGPGFPANFDDWTHDHCEVARLKVLLAIRKGIVKPARSPGPKPDEFGVVGPLDPDTLVAWLESGSTTWGLDYGDLMRRTEAWGRKKGFPARFVDWSRSQCERARAAIWKHVQSGSVKLASDSAGPVGNIHDADPDRAIGPDGEVASDDSVHGGQARKPLVDRMPDPPKPGRVRAWAKDLETRSGVAIAVPWKHQAWTVYKDQIKPDRALDDYNDRERDLFYRFALWCLGFCEAPTVKVADAGPDDPAELRSAILDMAERLIRIQSEVGHAPDEEPIKSVDRKTIYNLLLVTYRDAFKRLNRSEGPNTFDIATNQDWPVLGKMREILRLRLSEIENELARAREDRASRTKGGKRSA